MAVESMELKSGSGSSLVKTSPLNSSFKALPIAFASDLLFSICLLCIAARLYILPVASVAASSTAAVDTTKALEKEECTEMKQIRSFAVDQCNPLQYG